MTDEDTGIKVVVVDDHDLFRSGLTAMLNCEDDIAVIGQASRAAMGVRLALELRPDVVLMDLRLPDMSGIEATRQLLAQAPSARVLMLTVATGEADVEAALLAGACGYLLKDAPMNDVVSAIRAASCGDSWLSPRAASTLLDRIRRRHIAPGDTTDPTALLSPREVEVLRLVARGLDNARIAEQLYISPRTAKNHLSSILSKLGMDNRVQAAIYAVRHGLD